LLFACTYCCLAAESDTIDAKLPEITVKAGRLSVVGSDKYSPVGTIGTGAIRESGAIQINELLSTTPGLYIKNFGGTGGVKIVSLRGATSQRAVYMLDGIRINTAQTGSVDLSVIPLFLLDAIEIARGGSSALYGGSSLGGVINFSTGSGGGKLAVNSAARIGSYGEKSVSGGVMIPLGNWFAGVNAEYVDSDGDYPFEFTNFGKTGTYYRKNADFRNAASMLTVGRTFDNAAAKLNILSRFTDRGVPGPVVQNHIENSNDRLKENELTGSFSFAKSLACSGYSISAAGKVSGMNYRSPSIAGYLTENDFTEQYAYLGFRYYYTGLEWAYTELTADYSFNDVDYKYSNNIRDYNKRTALSASARFETVGIKLADFLQAGFQGGLRYDDYVGSFTALSPVLSTGLSAWDGELALRFQWARNFRAPNFSELYYLNFGNRNLKPEKSSSLNLGLVWTPADWLKMAADWFAIDTKDQIQSVPVSPAAWTSSNFSEVATRGVELAAEAALFDRMMKMSFNYTLQSVQDVSNEDGSYTIPYVPEEMLNVMVQLSPGNFQFGADASYCSFRYTLPGNSTSSVLPEYMLVNAFASWKPAFDSMKFNLRFDALNIFDKQYQVVLNYPMPGIQFRLSLIFNYKDQ